MGERVDTDAIARKFKEMNDSDTSPDTFGDAARTAEVAKPMTTPNRWDDGSIVTVDDVVISDGEAAYHGYPSLVGWRAVRGPDGRTVFEPPPGAEGRG